jgi:hypothetical protein
MRGFGRFEVRKFDGFEYLELRGFGGLEVYGFDRFKDLSRADSIALIPRDLMTLNRMTVVELTDCRYGECADC